jgi:hypothetical protein
MDGSGLDIGQALPALETFLRGKHSTTSWHFILNNTTTTRPNSHGGSLFRSLTALEQTRPTSNSDNIGPGHYACTISMPCSFDVGDGEGFTVNATGKSKNESIESACLRVFATLLLKDKHRVVCRSSHWSCSLDEVHQGISEIVHNAHQHQAESSEVPATTVPQSFYTSAARSRVPNVPGSASTLPSAETMAVSSGTSVGTPTEEVAELFFLRFYSTKAALPTLLGYEHFQTVRSHIHAWVK